MRDIREDLLQRSFGIVSRCSDATAQFDEQLQKLHAGHRKLLAAIHCEKSAVDAMLAIENSRPPCDIKTAERDALQKVLVDQILPTIEAIKKKVDAFVAEPKPLPFFGAGDVRIEKPAETQEGRDQAAKAETTTTQLRNLSKIVRQYPWEKTSQEQCSAPPREREASLLQTPAEGNRYRVRSLVDNVPPSPPPQV